MQVPGVLPVLLQAPLQHAEPEAQVVPSIFSQQTLISSQSSVMATSATKTTSQRLEIVKHTGKASLFKSRVNRASSNTDGEDSGNGDGEELHFDDVWRDCS